MKFTAELPTKPGIYLWKWHENDSTDLTWVIQGDDQRLWRELGKYPATNGLWCRLVPADEVVPKEEVEKAWREGISCAVNISDNRADSEWTNSRARKVMEGKE